MTAYARRGGAVLGAPIAHSLSPVLHQAAYDALGLSDWSYRAVECDEADLERTLRGLEAEGLAGVSLTMPLKRAVLPMLARSDRLVADVGAANTVLFGGVAGEWYGANTDVSGFVAAIQRNRESAASPGAASSGGPSAGAAPGAASPGAAPGAAKVDTAAVLGGGATAASAVAALRELGVGAVDVFVRRPERCGDLLAATDRLGVTVELRPYADAGGALSSYDLVISTTPAGATDELARQVELSSQAPPPDSHAQPPDSQVQQPDSQIELSSQAPPLGSRAQPSAHRVAPGGDGVGAHAPSGAPARSSRAGALGVLFDVVYAPWPTPLAQAWARAGGGVIGGLELLVEQAAVQVTLMTGRPAPIEAMRSAGLAAVG